MADTHSFDWENLIRRDCLKWNEGLRERGAERAAEASGVAKELGAWGLVPLRVPQYFFIYV